MQHVNVRFLGRRFAEAERAALAMLDRPGGMPRQDKWSFLREVWPGAALRVETIWDGDAQTLLHRLVEGDAPDPSATLATVFGGAAPPATEAANWVESGRSELGPAGGPGHEDLFRLANHAVAHLGLDRYRLRREDGALALGSAIVAFDVHRTAALAAGAPVLVGSRLGRPGRSSIRLLHRVHHAATGEASAQVEATHVFFDMATRRPVTLPTALRQAALSGTDYDDA